MNAPVPEQVRSGTVRLLATWLLALAALGGAWWWQSAQPPGGQRVVTVGLYENPPKVYSADDGRPSGLFVELLDAVARQEGWQLRYVPCRWTDCLQQLAQGRLDLMPDVAYTAERDQRFDFHTVSVASSWSQVYTTPQLKVMALPDLAGRRVAVLQGGIQQSYFAQLMASGQLRYQEVPVSSLEEGYAAVATGQADAVLTNSFYAAANGARYRLHETPIVFLPSNLYFATTQGRNADLLARIDARLTVWRSDADSVYFQVLRRAMAAPPEVRVPAWVRWAMPVLGAVLALLAGITLLLRWQVAQRTRALALSARALEHERANLERQVSERTARLSAVAESLQRSTEEQQAVFDAATVGIVLTRDDTIVRCNRTMERLLGHEPGTLLGASTRVLYPDDDSFLRAGRLISAGVTERGFFSEEGPFMHHDGHLVWCRLMVQAIDRQDLAKGFAGTFEDITVQRAAIAEMAKARALAEDAARAKADFLANMSHEIRTPMNSVIGMTYLALRADPPAPLRGYLQKIQRSGKHLLGVVDDILDFSRSESGQLAVEHIPFDLNLLLDDVAGLVAERAAAKGLTTRIQVDADVPRQLVGDPLRLRQVLLNYANNAVKFTEQGETTLQVRLDSAAGSTGGAGDEVVLRFSVRDTGIGLDAAQCERLFQSFQQADTSITRRYGGSGLGLAIAKRLTTLMGGEVGVSSTPGLGSTFWFTARLGVAHTPPPPERQDAAPAPPVAGEPDLARLAGARALLVEDNELNQEVAQALLASLGLEVHIAHDGAQALGLVQQHDYDVVLMDVQMPVMDGLSATRAIRRLPGQAGLPILAMTANAMAGDREHCLEAGMNDHVAKPFELDDLVAKLLRWTRARPVAAAPAPQDKPEDAPR